MDSVGISQNSFAAIDQLSERHNFGHVIVENGMHILGTKQTPEFIFSNEGIIKIQGRGLYSDKPELSDQIMNWIDGYINNPAKVTYVTMEFEYLNSLSMSVLVYILGKLSQIIFKSKKIVVEWYYDNEDENILDRGKYISSSCHIPIEFIMTNSNSHNSA